MTKDMTRGNPGKILFLFALPILFGNIFQQLYSMVDSIVVGNFVGSDALAAVGGSYAITFAITGIAFGLSNGASILIGQYFGAGRKREVRHSIVTCVAFSIALSLVLAAVSILATPALLRLLNTPESLMSMSKQYIYIYFLGLVFTFTYNILSSVFRALGDSKTPLLFLIISSITNIVLDLWFVISFGWGVAGGGHRHRHLPGALLGAGPLCPAKAAGRHRRGR